MDRNFLNEIVDWCQRNKWVMTIEAFSPNDMHALPKGKILELFYVVETLAKELYPEEPKDQKVLVKSGAHPSIKKDTLSVIKMTQREKIEGHLKSGPMSLVQIAKAINNKSVANVQKTLNAMIKDKMVKRNDDNHFELVSL